jgi:cell division protein FtsW (lipid II flippase)
VSVRPEGRRRSTRFANGDGSHHQRDENRLLGLAAAFVLAAVVALAMVPAARSGVWAVSVDSGILAFGVIWLACAVSAITLVRRGLPYHDPYLLPVVFLLAGWGLALIWRLAPGFGLRQTIWLPLSTAAMLAIALLPRMSHAGPAQDLRWLRRYRYTWLLLGLVITALTLVVGVNPSGAGERLWLGCCGLYLQPAEILKLLLVVFLASYLADRRELLFETQPGGPIRVPATRGSLVYFLPMLAMWGFSVVILVTQRDLGMSTLFFGIFIAMLYLASGRLVYIAVGAVLLLAAALLGYVLFDVVRLRVEAWWNPWADPSGRSYQIVQSLIAFAAGGVLGRGPGLGNPGVIPVAHSDFIFAALAEEWGLLGVTAVVCLLGLVVFRGLHIAAKGQSRFGQLLAGGLATAVGLQTLLILGGVVKLTPLTGVTLPFVSYGGSSLLANFCLVGLLLRLSAAVPARAGTRAREVAAD